MISPSYLIFGDVHGDSKSLGKLLGKAREEVPGPLSIWSIGDLIDRGPDPRGVVDLCIANGVNLVLGNHDLWMHEWCSQGTVKADLVFHKSMGGKKTLWSYGVSPSLVMSPETPSNSALASALEAAVPQNHRDYFKAAVLWKQLRHNETLYMLSHGGIPKDLGEVLLGSIRETEESQNMSVSDEEVAALLYDLAFQVAPERVVWEGAKKGGVCELPAGAVQVFGHTPWRGGAEIAESFVALDTGCGTCPPYNLSGLLLTEDGRRGILSSRSKTVRWEDAT